MVLAHKGVSSAISRIIDLTKRSHRVKWRNYLSAFIKLYRNILFPSQLSWISLIWYDFTRIKTVDRNVVTVSICSPSPQINFYGVWVLWHSSGHLETQTVWCWGKELWNERYKYECFPVASRLLHLPCQDACVCVCVRVRVRVRVCARVCLCMRKEERKKETEGDGWF